MIPYSRLKLKLSDLYTLSQSEQLENHTLHNGTYLCSPYLAVPPRGGWDHWIAWVVFRISEPKIPDSTIKTNIPESGFHKQKFPKFWNN